MKAIFHTLSEDFYNSDQSWHYKATYVLGDYKLRVTIIRNAYDVQSYARIQVFNPNDLKWNELAALPFNDKLACFKVSYVQTNAPIGLFQRDAKTLLERAKAILS